MHSTKIILSKDGSHTLYRKDLDETYHSTHGAYTEAMHVFIKNGFSYLKKEELKIFELGFGTGLNAVLSYREAIKSKKKVEYHAIELFPLSKDQLHQLNYSNFISQAKLWNGIHDAAWDRLIDLHACFKIHKIEGDFINFQPFITFDLIYFDAFAPNKQAELWGNSIFEKCYNMLSNNGVLVTYCAKGEVRRTLQSLGFAVERLEGPPGKREMLRATKKYSK